MSNKSKRIKNNLMKRAIILLVVLLMVSQVFVLSKGTVLADTFPYTGDATTGDNQPRMVGHRIYDIEDWSPETDPYAELMRASVPLQERIEPFAATQANPKLKSDAEILVMGGDYGNSFFEGLPYNNDFSQYLYNFWQYTDYYASWHGVVTKGVPMSLYEPDGPWQNRFFEFGMINVPNPSYTNAAHKNGVKSLGTIFLPRAGQAPKQMIEQDEKGEFPIGKKLIEFANYYGFDGFFINLEETVPAADVPIYKQFTKYLMENGLYVQSYDSILPDGRLQYQNQLNAQNSHWIKDDKYGNVNDSLFINYDWFRSNRVETSLQHAAERGIDPFKQMFFGVEAAQGKLSGSHGSASDVDKLLDATGNLMSSVALFTPSDFIQLHLDRKAEKPENQWMIAERERMYYSGVLMDPTDTGKKAGHSRPDVDASDASGWVGVAHFASERSVVNDSTFVTNFNTGHGMEYYQNGAVVNENQWSNINLQDILPTWQWWMETKSKNKLAVDFDYGKKYNTEAYSYTKVGAYDGGSSLVVAGKLDAENFLRLYKTNLDVKSKSKLSITYNKTSKTDKSTMKVGLIFKDKPNKIEYMNVPASDKKSETWVTTELDLSKFAGKEISAIGLSFDPQKGPAIEKYQMNIGEIKITNDSNVTPKTPTGFMVKEAYDTNEMVVSWDKEDYSKVKLYNLYANLSNGKRVYLGGTYGDTFYIKSLYDEKNIVNLELKAVGPDKTESQPAKISYDFSTKVSDITVVESLSKSGNVMQSANADFLDVSWKNPNTEYTQINLEVSLLNSTNKETFKKTVKKGTTSTQIPISIADGSEYSLAISVVGSDKKQGKPILYTGKLKDESIEPYNGEIKVAKSGTSSYLSLDAPRQEDWWKMYAYVDGEPLTFQNEYTTATPYGTRGKSYLNSSTASRNIKVPTASGVVTIVMEDYSGNLSEPVDYTYGIEEVNMTIDHNVLERTKKAQLSLKKKLSSDGSLVDMNIKDENIEFMSGNPNIATVDKNGIVTAKKVGSTEITAKVTIGNTVYMTNNVKVTVEHLKMEDQGGFKLTYDPSIVEVGEESIVTITADQVKDLAGFDIRFSYDQDVLELKEVVANKDFGFTDYKDKDGVVSMLGALTGKDKGLSGDIELVQLVFTAKDKDAMTSISLLEGSQLSDIEAALYTVGEPLDEKIAIANSDITGGGTAINDLVLVAKAFDVDGSRGVYDAKLDMNKDGVIDIIDIAYVAARVLKR